MYNIFIRYVNGCHESKILSLKYPHLQLLIETSQFYMGSILAQKVSWYKVLKSKHLYLRNHGFLLCEKFQCLKFR